MRDTIKAVSYLILGIVWAAPSDATARTNEAQTYQNRITRRQAENGGISIPLMRKKAREFLTEDEFAEWAQIQGDLLKAKYGSPAGRLGRRAVGVTDIVNRRSNLIIFHPLVY